MNETRRWMKYAGTLLLALSMLTASCEAGGRTGNGSGNGSAGSEEPVVITTARVLNDSDFEKLKDGDTIDDNPITRWAKDKLGVIQSYKWIVADEAALEQQVKQAIAGHEELPDVLYLNDSILPVLLGDLAASGKFMDVEEAFDRYASDRLKEAYRLNPDVWRTVHAEGKRWGLPQISDGKVGDPILWIREDWLNALGLKTPTTLDELEKVFDAFTNGDPDGNGVKDTYGFALSGKNNVNSWLANASFVFGAYGRQPSQWNRADDGSLAYGSIQPEIEPGLAKLRDWYAKGYIHPNFGTHDELTAVAFMTDGAAGVVSGPGWMGGWPLGETGPRNDPSTPKFKPIPYPSGPDGKVGRKGSKISYGAYVFRKDFAHMDKVFAYLDEVYGASIEDPESDFVHGFGENYDYKIVDGEVVYEFEGMTSTISSHIMLTVGSVPPGVMEESLESRVYRGKIETPYEKKQAITASRLFLEGIIVGDQQLEHAEPDRFMGAYSLEMQKKWPALQQLEKETFLKIVYGEEPPSSFGRFVQEWLDYGGDRLTREVNAWDKERP